MGLSQVSRPWNSTTCAQKGWSCFALHLRALRFMRPLTFYCPRLESQPVGDNKKVNAFWAWQCSKGQGQGQGRRARPRARANVKGKANGKGQWQGQCQGQWQGARFQSEVYASFSKIHQIELNRGWAHSLILEIQLKRSTA